MRKRKRPAPREKELLRRLCDETGGQLRKGIRASVNENGNITRVYIVCCNEATSLPDDFAMFFPYLYYLELCRCVNLRNISPVFSCRLLRRLEIFDCGITAVPAEIGGLLNLRYLKLDVLSYIKTLPPMIGNLGRLEHFHVSSCDKLVAFPDEIGSLSHLRRLIVSNCKTFTEIPDTIGNLKRLRIVEFSRCPLLSHVPRSIWSLPRLDLVKLFGNNALEESIVPALDDFSTSIQDVWVYLLECPKKPWFRTLCYYVELNRAGRKILNQDNMIPDSLWSKVLGRCSSKPNAIYFFLKQKPSLVQRIEDVD